MTPGGPPGGASRPPDLEGCRFVQSVGIEPLVGESGWPSCSRITVNSLEAEGRLVLVGTRDSGQERDDARRRFFDLPGVAGPKKEVPQGAAATLTNLNGGPVAELMEELSTRNRRWFDTEMDKLDRWAEDRRASLKNELDEFDSAIREARRASRLAPNLPEKLNRQRELRALETKRDEAWDNYEQGPRDRGAEGCAAGQNQPAASPSRERGTILHDSVATGMTAPEAAGR